MLGFLMRADLGFGGQKQWGEQSISTFGDLMIDYLDGPSKQKRVRLKVMRECFEQSVKLLLGLVDLCPFIGENRFCVPQTDCRKRGFSVDSLVSGSSVGTRRLIVVVGLSSYSVFYIYFHSWRCARHFVLVPKLQLSLPLS